MARKARKRPSLASWLKHHLLTTAMNAADGENDIEARIAEALSKAIQTPAFLMRYQAASPQERAGLAKHLETFVQELTGLGAAPPDPERLYADAAHVWPELASHHLGDRVRAATPDRMRLMLRAGAETVSDDGDRALAAAGDGDAPSQAALAVWIAGGGCPTRTLDAVVRRLAPAELAPDAARVSGWAFGGLIVWWDGESHHIPATLIQAAAHTQQDSALVPLVKAWQRSRPKQVEPQRWRNGIVPQFLATRTPMLPGFERVEAPTLPSLVVPTPDTPAYLPGLEPDSPPEPALLLALFDAGGGLGVARNGLASVDIRVFLEVLLGHPPAERDGQLKETVYSVSEIVEDWLQWKRRNYRVTGRTTGGALREGLRRLRDIAIPMNDRGGFYFPVMVSAGQGWNLDDKIAFVTRLPPSRVGPRVDRHVLRRLGKRSGPAYRAYVNLCFEWDRYGGHNGKLIRPTRPVVRRAEGGQVVDAHGQIITTRGGKPVYSPHDRRAIKTGQREDNPDRKRYPDYSADDSVFLFYGPGHRDPKYRERTDKHAELGEKAGAWTIEKLGDSPTARWRIMPSDRFDDL